MLRTRSRRYKGAYTRRQTCSRNSEEASWRKWYFWWHGKDWQVKESRMIGEVGGEAFQSAGRRAWGKSLKEWSTLKKDKTERRLVLWVSEREKEKQEGRLKRQEGAVSQAAEKFLFLFSLLRMGTKGFWSRAWDGQQYGSGPNPRANIGVVEGEGGCTRRVWSVRCLLSTPGSHPRGGT